MASTSQTNPAYDIPLFNARDHLVALHQEITDFLHYQSHVWYVATTSLPPNTSATNQREWQTIIEFLKEEHTHIKTLKQLLNMADNNATELHSLFKDLPVSANVNWGEVNWGPALQWEQPLPPPQDKPQAKWRFSYPICIPQ